MCLSVEDAKLFISDPDPDADCQVVTDPEPTCQITTDPDPTFQVTSDPDPDPFLIFMNPFRIKQYFWKGSLMVKIEPKKYQIKFISLHFYTMRHEP